MQLLATYFLLPLFHIILSYEETKIVQKEAEDALDCPYRQLGEEKLKEVLLLCAADRDAAAECIAAVLGQKNYKQDTRYDSCHLLSAQALAGSLKSDFTQHLQTAAACDAHNACTELCSRAPVFSS
jgi:phosphoribosylpyrophosphate synthetase